jgi:hypothetical protein
VAIDRKQIYTFAIAFLEKIVKSARLLLFGALLFALAGAGPAWARGHHGGHASVGLYFGVPLGVPYYYPPAYYYPPTYYYPAPVVVAPPAPTYYIEREPASPPPGGYWYYCRDPQGYYPQIQHCPTPWQQVPAQPSTR